MLLARQGGFDIFNLPGLGDLGHLGSYSTGLQVLDFETRDGFLYLLTAKDAPEPLATFQIVDMNLGEPGVIAEVVAETPMFKQGHDLDIEGRYAYILDNIVAPFLVGIVDIADPHDPAAEWLELFGVNQPLLGQDIGERWFILSVSGVREGTFSSLRILGKEPPPTPLATLNVGFVPRGDLNFDSEGIRGFVANRVFVHNDELFVIGSLTEDVEQDRETALAVYDASDPESPRLLGVHTIEPGGAGPAVFYVPGRAGGTKWACICSAAKSGTGRPGTAGCSYP